MKIKKRIISTSIKYCKRCVCLKETTPVYFNLFQFSISSQTAQCSLRGPHGAPFSMLLYKEQPEKCE